MAQKIDRWAEAKARDEAEKAERERRRAETDRVRAEAHPIKIVDVRIPIGSLFVLAVQIGIIWLGMGAIGAAVLLALGVI